jgi:cytochrome c
MVRVLKLAGVVLAGVMAAAAGSASAADANAGKGVFTAQCSVCHTATKGGPALVGPNLYGVVGRAAGSLSNFAYSPAIKASGITWTNAKLAQYLAAPAATIPGNKMPYAGLKPQAKLDDLIAYLDTLK